MKSKLLIGLMVFLLIFAAGCKKQEQTTAGKAFLGGTQGLQISFLSGLPPADVFDKDNPFQVGVKIENKGEFDIETASDIDVSVTGINPQDFGVTASQLMLNSPEPIKGVKIDGSGNVIAGDFVTLEFPEMNYEREVSGTVPFTVRANVCYEYGTKAQGKLCVRKDLRGVTGEAGVCDPLRQVPAENSGAPIQITNIRQTVSGSNKIDFFFTIRNMGAAGDSLHKSGSSCDTAVANRDVVYIEVADTGLGELTCSGLRDGTTGTSGYVTLFNNEREVRCSQTLDAPEDFEKVVEINLRYSYKQYVDTQLNVKHTS
jgi:hypothetical protein